MCFQSRPSRARGLKPEDDIDLALMFTRSRPSRARGLKHKCAKEANAICLTSRPSRARGLKLSNKLGAGEYEVAPFTGAWIETYSASHLLFEISSRALHGRVD